MNHRALVLRGLRFYWRTKLGVLGGVAVAAAVLTGGLLVGDSVRFSLRHLALQRLAGCEYAMLTGRRFFAADLAARLATATGRTVASVLQLDGTLARAGAGGPGAPRRARVRALGVADTFWSLAEGEVPPLDNESVGLSRKVAVRLGLSVGDEVVLRAGTPALMPRDSPLSASTDQLSERGLYTVAAIVPDDQLGRFGLEANQVAPYNVFVPLDRLQEHVGLPGRVNLLLVGEGDTALTASGLNEALGGTWRLDDIGLGVRAVGKDAVVQLESDRVFLDGAVGRAALDLGDGRDTGPVGALTYLVNTVSLVRGGQTNRTPYGFAVALTPSDDGRLGPVPADMADDEIVVNRWVADQVDARVGDTVVLAYYELRGSQTFVERTRDFRVRGIAEMVSLAAERELVPDFPGLADVDSCAEWDVGMPLEEELLADEDNEAYWDEFRQTPKVFVTLRAGREMWANRFGDLTAVRFASGPGGMDVEAAVRESLTPESVGLFFVPVREQAERAVAGSMDFGGLFLGMSFFLIAAAVVLACLLFAFEAEQREREIGTYLALGYRRRSVRRLLIAESLVVVVIGSLAGTIFGILYTKALIWGLQHYWGGAIAGAAVRFHAEPATALIGAAATIGLCTASLAVTTSRLARLPARELLAAGYSRDVRGMATVRRPHAVRLALALALVLSAVAVVACALAADVERPAGAFFGSGALLLSGGLAWLDLLLRRLSSLQSTRPGLLRVGVRSAARRPGRSLAAIALLAAGTFLIVAVFSMQEDLSAHAAERWSGTGGFELFGESAAPVPVDLNSGEGRRRFRIGPGELPDSVHVVSLRVHDGDDASCLNLNRAQAPRLLGVDAGELRELGAFLPEQGGGALWSLLEEELPNGAVPGIVGDSDTATWGLQKQVGRKHGEFLVYRDERGTEFRVKLVAALPMRLSVFQGSVLVSAKQFADRFPSEGGYRAFLVDAPGDAADRVAGVFDRRLAEVGMDLTPATDRLAEFYSVEQTYLRMFLVLGGLGMLLGTVGLGVVVMRTVLERRAELGLLRAVGYSAGRVRALLLCEHGLLLVAGIGCGSVSALVAVLPAALAPGIAFPFASAAAILGLVFVSGAAWTLAATVFATRGDLIAALRDE